MSQRAAIRNRKRIAKGNRHLAKMGRPQYKAFTRQATSAEKPRAGHAKVAQS